MSDSRGSSVGPGSLGDDPAADEGDLEPADAVLAGSVSSGSTGGAAVAGGPLAGGSVALRAPRRGPLARVRSIGTFYRQVVAELRKVIWPTRQELLTYTSVVVVFVVVMVLIVSLFDFAFSQAVLRVFGDSSL